MQILSQISLSFNEYDIAINIITKALTIRIENGIFETSVITDAVKTGNIAIPSKLGLIFAPWAMLFGNNSVYL